MFNVNRREIDFHSRTRPQRALSAVVIQNVVHNAIDYDIIRCSPVPARPDDGRRVIELYEI